MKTELFIFNKWPLERLVNRHPGDLLCDISGDIYLVDGDYDINYISPSVLMSSERIDGLSEIVYKKLFVTLTLNELRSLGYGDY